MKILIFGCGNMGGAIAKRLSPLHEVILFDRNSDKAMRLQEHGYGNVSTNLNKDIKQSDVVILAVKPQNLAEAAKFFGRNLGKKQVLASLLAGMPLNTLRKYFPSCRLIRMMPNLAIIHGEGLIGLCAEDDWTIADRSHFNHFCEPLGKVFWLPEEKMNAFTSLAGSGPAFVLTIMEAMIEAGIGMGFSAADSQTLVNQMIKGSLALVEKHGRHPGELKWQVTSPSGTTIVGLRRLEEHGLRSGIINTFLAAYERSQEMV